MKRNYKIDFINLFYTIVITQYISLSLLFNFGFLGSPNSKTKNFLNDDIVTSIINSNTIYLLSVDSKIQTLLSYYLPSSKVINTFDDITMIDYIITSDAKVLNKLKRQYVFKSIKKFDNNFLLMNISN